MSRFFSFLIRVIPRKYLLRFTGIGSWWLRVVAGVFYKGNTVQCPICKKSYHKFLPYGRAQVRPNALCPFCLSLERHRLIWLYLKRKTTFFDSPKDVLHIAPESCFMPSFKQLHGHRYITGDLESPLATIKINVHEIPFSEGKFDVVMCNHVLEHVEDDKQAIREIYRVLKPGGWAILQVPFFSPIPDETWEDHSITAPQDREEAFGQTDHLRRYGHDYAKRLQSCGFDVEVSSFVKELTPIERARYAVNSDEDIYHVRRPEVAT